MDDKTKKKKKEDNPAQSGSNQSMPDLSDAKLEKIENHRLKLSIIYIYKKLCNGIRTFSDLFLTMLNRIFRTQNPFLLNLDLFDTCR